MDGSYNGASVLLIEDLISTGSSSIKAVEAIRGANGVCDTCLGIFTYGLQASYDAFDALKPSCCYHTILSYDLMVKIAEETGYINAEEAAALREWRADPFGWGEKRGFAKE